MPTGIGTYLAVAAQTASNTLSTATNAVHNLSYAAVSASTGGRELSASGRRPIKKSFTDSLQSRLENSDDANQIHLERIVVLDEAKEPYKIGISRVDSRLLDIVENVNDKLNDVNDAYQARIDAGCKTDLFWRLILKTVIGVGTTSSSGYKGKSQFEQEGADGSEYYYICTKLDPKGYSSLPNPTDLMKIAGLPKPEERGAYPDSINLSVGFGTDSVDMVGVGTTSNGITVRSLPLDTLEGLEKVNLYGLKMYDEPYTVDVGDTFITQFIGTCGVGTNTVIAMSPINVGGLQESIRVGQLVICDKPGVFIGAAYSIIGVGTAIANLSGINTVSTGVTASVVLKLTLDANVIDNAFAPEDGGSFVTFTVLSDPNSLGNLGISNLTSPFVPQTVKCPMVISDKGKGVRIEFVNNGDRSCSTTWNPFMEGEVNPDATITATSASSILAQMEANRVKEPKVGAGRLHYRLGFDYAPVIYDSNGPYQNANGDKYKFAEEFDEVILKGFAMDEGPAAGPAYFRSFVTEPIAGIEPLPSCSSSINTAIGLAITVADQTVAGIANTTIQSYIELANMLRDDVMDINLRIWGERILLGDSTERITTYANRQSTINLLGDILGDY